MSEIVRTDTGQLLSNRAATKLIADAGYKTQITDKTSAASLAVWGEKVFGAESGVTFTRAAETESPGPNHRKTGYAEKGTDNIWRPIYEPITYDMEQVRVSAIQQINAHFQELADEAAGRYPDFEMKTWPDQEAEALACQAWVANGSVAAAKPACTVLTGIATQRGITLAVLATRVLDNAANWRALAADLAGQRQAYADRAYLAADKLAVDAILEEMTAPPATEEIEAA